MGDRIQTERGTFHRRWEGRAGPPLSTAIAFNFASRVNLTPKTSRIRPLFDLQSRSQSKRKPIWRFIRNSPSKSPSNHKSASPCPHDQHAFAEVGSCLCCLHADAHCAFTGGLSGSMR